MNKRLCQADFVMLDSVRRIIFFTSPIIGLIPAVDDADKYKKQDRLISVGNLPAMFSQSRSWMTPAQSDAARKHVRHTPP